MDSRWIGGINLVLNKFNFRILLKFPTLKGSPDPNAASGFGYAYADTNTPLQVNHILRIILQGY